MYSVIYAIEGVLLLYWQRKQKIYMYGSLKFETIQELFGDHLEGNTKLIFHAKHADQRPKILAKSLSEVMTLIYL